MLSQQDSFMHLKALSTTEDHAFLALEESHVYKNFLHDFKRTHSLCYTKNQRTTKSRS
jgi:hypothetical protein